MDCHSYSQSNSVDARNFTAESGRSASTGQLAGDSQSFDQNQTSASARAVGPTPRPAASQIRHQSALNRPSGPSLQGNPPPPAASANSNHRSSPRARSPLGAREDSSPELPCKRSSSASLPSCQYDLSGALPAAKAPSLLLPGAQSGLGVLSYPDLARRSHHDVAASAAVSLYVPSATAAFLSPIVAAPPSAPPSSLPPASSSHPAVFFAPPPVVGSHPPPSVGADSPLAPRCLLPEGSGPGLFPGFPAPREALPFAPVAQMGYRALPRHFQPPGPAFTVPPPVTNTSAETERLLSPGPSTRDPSAGPLFERSSAPRPPMAEAAAAAAAMVLMPAEIDNERIGRPPPVPCEDTRADVDWSDEAYARDTSLALRAIAQDFTGFQLGQKVPATEFTPRKQFWPIDFHYSRGPRKGEIKYRVPLDLIDYGISFVPFCTREFLPSLSEEEHTRLMDTAAMRESFRCFFLHLAVELGVHPVALQVVPRRPQLLLLFSPHSCPPPSSLFLFLQFVCRDRCRVLSQIIAERTAADEQSDCQLFSEAVDSVLRRRCVNNRRALAGDAHAMPPPPASRVRFACNATMQQRRV